MGFHGQMKLNISLIEDFNIMCFMYVTDFLEGHVTHGVS